MMAVLDERGAEDGHHFFITRINASSFISMRLNRASTVLTTDSKVAMRSPRTCIEASRTPRCEVMLVIHAMKPMKTTPQADIAKVQTSFPEPFVMRRHSPA